MSNECEITYHHHKGPPRTPIEQVIPTQNCALGLGCGAAEDELSEKPIGSQVPHPRRVYKLRATLRGRHRASCSASFSFACTDRKNNFPIDPTR